MKRFTFILAFLIYTNCVFSQDIGFHVGHQMFGIMNAKQPIHGLSIGLDIPRTGFVTPYGQVTLFAPFSIVEENIGSGIPKDLANPYILDVDGKIRTMTFSLEFGTIYYLGGAYDYGFSFMMHNSIRLSVMPTSVKLQDFDFRNYDFQANSPNWDLAGYRGFAFNTSFGIGAKNTFEWGSLYGLVGLELLLMGDRFPQYYYNTQGSISPLAFSTRIGLRRDLDFSSKKQAKDKPLKESSQKERRPSRRELRNNM